MDKDYRLLKRAALSRSSGQWSDDDFDVLCDGTVVGRIFKANAAPVGTPWMWTLAFGHHDAERPHPATTLGRDHISGWRRHLSPWCQSGDEVRVERN